MIYTDIVYTVEDVLKFYKDYSKETLPDVFLETFEVVPTLTSLSENVDKGPWNQSYETAKETLEYIDRLKSKVYVICVEENKINTILLFSPKGQPKEYLPYLKDLDTKLKWSKEQRKEIKAKPWKFMACVLQYNNQDTDPKDHSYYKVFSSIQSKLKNGMYIFSIRDALLVRKDGMDPWVDITGFPVKLGFIPKQFLPVFNSTGGNDYWDIPIPTYEDLEFMKGIPEAFKAIELNWDKKLPIAVFRGGASGCGYDERNNQRIKLAKLGMDFNNSKDSVLMNLVDVGITAANKKKYHFHKDTGLGFIQNIPLENRLTKRQQSQYKYVFEIEGNVAAHRIASDMLFGSVPLLVETDYTLWFTHLLKPYVHYIPLKGDFSDLVEKLYWCHNHDKECHQIANNARMFALDILKKEVIINVFTNSINFIK
jgi:hypothetical protein